MPAFVRSIILLSIMLTPASLIAQNWQFFRVDDGVKPALDLDPDDVPHVSYMLEAIDGSETTIAYTIPRADYLTLRIYDLLGREVRTPVTGYQSAGTHTVLFNTGSLSKGLYIYTLHIGSTTLSKMMMVVE
jgi:hypothetical protein